MRSEDVFRFTIASRAHGMFEVTAPLRFRAEVEQHSWHVQKGQRRAPGREFMVVTNFVRDDGTRKTLFLHRLVWELSRRPFAKNIDHVDGQPLNNAEDNLRDGTTGNHWNRRRRATNTSGMIGVYWHKGTCKWVARIRCNGEHFFLGCFTSKDEAARARDAAAIKYHGEFAVLNMPKELP